MRDTLEHAFADAMWDDIHKIAKKYGYYVGGGSHVEVVDGKRHIDFGFIATPKRSTIPRKKLIDEHNAVRRKWARKRKAKWLNMFMRKSYEWDSQTLHAGKKYHMWDENNPKGETVRILGFRKQADGEMFIYWEVLSDPANPVYNGYLHGTRIGGGTWSRKFKEIKQCT